MKKIDVVVVGGSAAGITASLTAKIHYPEKEVLLIRKEKKVLIPCGIPYIFGTVGSPEKNLIPDAILEKNGIQVLIDEVKSVDRDKKELSTASGEKIGYDRLILATGSVPAVPPIPGIDKENIFVAKKDVDYLQRFLETLKEIQDLVIVGGGFIGVEFADECRKNPKLNVSIIEMLPHCLMLSGFDEDFCSGAEGILSQNGVKVLTNERVESFTGDKKVTGVKLASGKELKADAVLVAIGVRPNIQLAKEAGLEMGATGAIKVNNHMRTSDPNIFACGDCTEKKSFFTGEPARTLLASVATLEARVAGCNLFKAKRENPGVIGVFSTRIGDTSFASAGLSARLAKQSGYEVVVGEAVAPDRHPGGMPEMKETKMRLTFNKDTGVLLGGQVMGGWGVGELINVVGACILHRMTANDIAQFQMGTHPALTASPIAYQLVSAAENAMKQMG